MHAHPSARHLRLAAVLAAACVAAPVAVASEVPVQSGQIIYTTGTAPARAERDKTVQIIEADMTRNTAFQQVASVDVSLLGTQATIGIQPATFERPSSERGDRDPLPSDRSVATRNVEGLKGREPGFWATALSTLALALFFFLRRLS